MIWRLIAKIHKLSVILSVHDYLWIKALRFGVAASIEHRSTLRHLDCRTVVDVGANRGQFALLAKHLFPDAIIISFEPLPRPAKIFQCLFSGDRGVTLYQIALGAKDEVATMHVSGRDDSSSLLPITSLQEKIFPGTAEVDTFTVSVAPLDSIVRAEDLPGPALLKIDVQGYELDALRGCDSLLHCFDWVYCECSFVELYSGQALAADVFGWLTMRGFRLIGIYNPSYDVTGRSVQADFLFRKVSSENVGA